MTAQDTGGVTMAVKCTECGASIQDDSKFCKYCGAKIVLDQTKKIEVKIDNTAEMRRAAYEEKESELRQIRMKRELRKEKRKPYIIGLKVLSVVIPLVACFLTKGDPVLMLSFIVVAGVLLAIYLIRIIEK
jgi:uncharacterized membrane protein YvbJ